MRYVYIAPNENEIDQRKGIKDYLFDRNIYMGDCTTLLSDYDYYAAQYNKGIQDMLSILNPGDILYVWDFSVLGKTLISIYTNLLYIYNKGITLIQCFDGELLSKDQTDSIATIKGIGIAGRIASGRIQAATKRGLAEKKRLIEEKGGFYNKKGEWVTRLGTPLNCDHSVALKAAAIATKERVKRWRDTSVGFNWAIEQFRLDRSYREIVEEFNRRRETNPEDYSTRTGKPLTEAILSQWIKYAGLEELRPGNSKNLKKWKQTNIGYLWFTEQIEKGISQEEVIKQFNSLHELDPQNYSTFLGSAMTEHTFHRWKKEILDNK